MNRCELPWQRVSIALTRTQRMGTNVTANKQLTGQLRRAEQVDEVLVVVEPPHAFTPRRLESKHLLDLSADVDVLLEDAGDECLFVRF